MTILRFDWLYENCPHCLRHVRRYLADLLIYDQHLEDHWIEDPKQQGAIEFRLLRVYRRDCTVHIAGNLSSYPMCPKFEEGYGERQKIGSMLDLLGTAAE